MVGGSSSKARTQYISAVVPPSTAAKHEQFESGYGSTNSTSDDSSHHQRTHTASSRKHRQKTPVLPANTYRSKSVLNGTYRRDSIEHISTKHQQQQLYLNPNNNCRRLITVNPRVLIDTKPVQKFIQNQKV
jgi:hypothetical protein